MHIYITMSIIGVANSTVGRARNFVYGTMSSFDGTMNIVGGTMSSIYGTMHIEKGSNMFDH